LGLESIQKLFEFFEEKGMCRRSGTPDTDKLWMTHDTSAFAAVYAEMGQSFFNPSGLAVTAQSERKITSPIFAKFVSYQTAEGDEFGWRGWHEYHRTSGSPFYLGARLTEMFIPRQMRNKVPPIFKFFNFDEYFEVLSLILCLALEQYFKAGQTITPCPLTSQQVQLMLRQAILPFFNNEMAQDLRLTADSWVPFLPFVVAPNGISQGNVGPGPLLPRFFAENIRCSKRIIAQLRPPRGRSSQVQSNNNSMEIDLIPVLGRVAPSVFTQLGNYTYLAPGATPLYATDPTEIPVNLVDASAVDGESTFYLDLNGKTQPLLVQAWNEWISQYAGVLVGLTNLSNDRGCEALAVLPYTNFHRFTPNAPEPPPEPIVIATANTKSSSSSSSTPGKTQRKVSRKTIGLDVSKLRKRVGAAPSPGPSEIFTSMVYTDSTATLGFTSELWKFLSVWVLPTAITYTNVFESCLSAYQTNQIEPFRLSSSSMATQFLADTSQNYYPVVYDRHMQFASMNIRSWNSPVKSEMEEEFETLTAKGEGGFFTKIAGVIGEGLGIHGSAKFMDTVGDLTGL
jgi:hypothetical protein